MDLPESCYDYRYEREDGPEVAGECVCCNDDVFTHQDHYIFNGEIVCEQCKDIYIEDFKVYGGI